MGNRYLNEAVSNVISEIAETGNLLWQKGWAERNAGNISVNISEYLQNNTEEELSGSESTNFPPGRSFIALSGKFFLVTGTGKRMRDLATLPEKNALIIRINEAGDGYLSILPEPSVTDLSPTSELMSHLAIHEQLIIRSSSEKTILHTHPTELVSLTHIGRFCDETALNQLLWRMHPETLIMIPNGAGFVPFMLPGTEEIAEATLKKFETHKVVVWEKHGCFSIGRNVSEAFDLIDTLVKSAQIYFQCRAAGHDPEGIPAESMNGLRELSRKFLQPYLQELYETRVGNKK